MGTARKPLGALTPWTLPLALILAATRQAAAPAEDLAVGYRTYDYCEQDEGVEKAVRLTIPANLSTVRGLFINTNAAGGDTRDRHSVASLRALAALHGLAFLGAKGFNSHLGSVTVLQHALDRFAAESGHGELVNVPFLVYGFSAGGGFADRLLNTLPERVIAAAPLSTAMRMEVPAAALEVPVCMFSGDREDRLVPLLTETMQAQRPRGAHWAWAMVEGQGHREGDQASLALYFLDRCLRLRYPATADPARGPVALTPFPLQSGWLADHTTWRSGLTGIAPYSDPGAAAPQTSWLPDKDTAFAYRAYATYGPALQLVNPPSGAVRVLDSGADLAIAADDAAWPAWRTMTLYDGATKLAEVTAGPLHFPLRNLQTGVHDFFVMGTDAAGLTRVSRPALVIVIDDPAR